MATLSEIRDKYPQYKDLSDNDLADRLHQRFYADMPRDQFNQQLGLAASPQRAAQGGPMDPLAQGATFGFSDELAGAFGAGMQALGVPGALGEMSPGDAYSAYRDRARGNLADYRERNPGTSTALEIAGALPTAAVAPFGAAAKGASVAARMGRGAGAGAVAGGVYGAGAADGGISDRARGAATTGLFGLGLGGAVPAVGAGIGAMVGGIGGRIATRGLSPAERKIARAFSDDQVTPAQAQQLGPAAMVADLGPNLRQQAAAIAATPGGGQKVIRDAIAARQAGATNRVTSSLDQNLGARSNVVQTADQIAAQRAQAAAPLYAQAYAAPIQVTPAMNRVLTTPAGREALTRAGRLAQNEGNPISGQLDTRALDYVKRGLDDMIEAANRTGNRQEARALNQLRTTLLSELDQQNPVFAQARAAYAGPASVLDAMEAGQSVFQRSLSPDQLRKEIASLGGAELDAFRQGARAQVTQIMGTARNDAGAAWRELAEKGWNREKLELIFGKPQADDLIRTLQAEKTFGGTADRVTQNSETAARFLGAAEVAGATPTQRALNRAKDAYSFGGTMGPVRAAQAAGIQKVIGALTGGKSDKVITDMARGLIKTGTDRDALIAALATGIGGRHASQRVAAKTDSLINALLGTTSRALVGPVTNRP